jgi:hypothetical protein
MYQSLVFNLPKYGVISYSPFCLQSLVISGSVVPLQFELKLFYRKILQDCKYKRKVVAQNAAIVLNFFNLQSTVP